MFNVLFPCSYLTTCCAYVLIVNETIIIIKLLNRFDLAAQDMFIKLLTMPV